MKPLTDRELDQRYNDFLDEVYGEVKIGAYEYSTSRALKEVDPVAYNCGFADWLDSECSAGVLVEHKGEYYNADEFDESEASA